MLVRVFAVLSIVAITSLPLAGCTGGTDAGNGGGGNSTDSDPGSSNTTTD